MEPKTENPLEKHQKSELILNEIKFLLSQKNKLNKKEVNRDKALPQSPKL